MEKNSKLQAKISGSTILVIGGSEKNLSDLSVHLKAWHCDFAVVGDEGESVAVIEAAIDQDMAIDCIILCENCAEEISSHKAFGEIPILLLTESSDAEVAEKHAETLGAQAQISTPVNASKLLETLARISRNEPIGNEPLVAPKSDEQANVSNSSRHEIDVLVCEDNEVNQIVFTQILQSAGYSFEIADNGKTGLEKLQSCSPGVILMDVSMPEMNGLEATSAIREMETKTGGRIPIIGVTAHAIKGDMEKCIDAGMDDYLSKPVSPDALQAKIESWIQTGKSARTAS